MKPRVELIYDSDCPNVSQARKIILQAFSEVNMVPSWNEIERSAADSPEYARQYGSPSILVDGQDVADTDGQNGDCCRLYVHEQEYRGVPELSQVILALKRSQQDRFSWRRFGAAVPSLLTLLPVLHCPACWPAYAGILSALGLGFLSEAAYLLPIAVVLLSVAVFALAYKARSRHGYKPLVAGIVASVAVLCGKFWLASDPLLYGGLSILVVASVWNAWPRKEACCAKD